MAKRGMAAADASVRAHPWESVGVAFVVGLVEAPTAGGPEARDSEVPGNGRGQP